MFPSAFIVPNVPCSVFPSFSQMPRVPFYNHSHKRPCFFYIHCPECPAFPFPITVPNALRFFYIHCPNSHVFPRALAVPGPPVTADSLNYFRSTPPHACVSRRHLPAGRGAQTSKDCVLIYTTILSVHIWKMTVANPSPACNCRCIRRFHADGTPRPYITSRRRV